MVFRMNSPLVSVCIPTFNHAKVVGDALRSAMAQRYQHLEILVVDNHSDDDTEHVIARIAAGDSRIRYVRNRENIGMARNFSACITLACGQYIKFLCADDVLDPDCVSAMVEALESSRDIALVGCARRLTDHRLATRRIAGARKRFARVEGASMVRECFAMGNRIGEPTAVMFRRGDALRGFDESYSQHVDLEKWFYLLLKGNFVFLADPLCSIRQHDMQATQVNLRHGRIVEDKRRLFRDFSPLVRGSMGLFEKCLWDGRMALSLVRGGLAGCFIEPRTIAEIFFRRPFPTVTYPLVAMLVRLGWTGS